MTNSKNVQMLAFSLYSAQISEINARSFGHDTRPIRSKASQDP